VGEVGLVDGTRVSVGDLIITRCNNRRLTVSGSDWVKNGDRWTVQQVHSDGSLQARRIGTRVSVVLPAGYVAEHVQLGYATTVHTAQGVTVDTAHAVVTGEQDRQVLYVAVTRGRTANHLYLVDGADGDPHTLTRPDTVNPPTAMDLLCRVLARDGSQQSATSTRRHLDAPATRLHDAVSHYTDALGYAAEQVLGTETLTALDREVDILWPGLTHEPAWSTLRGHLARHALDGTDPLLLLADATADGGLGTARDRAAVLAWRIGSTPTHEGPLPSLPAIPSVLRDDPDWGGYLQAREARIKTLADEVRADAERGQAHLDRATGQVPGSRETGDLHPWEEQLPNDVATDPAAPRLIERLTSLNQTGIDVSPALEAALNQPNPLPDDVPANALWWRVLEHLGPLAAEPPDDAARIWAKGLAQLETGSAPAGRWRSILEQAHPGITEDPGYPTLDETLRQAHAEGFDVSSELESLVQTRPLWATSAAVDLRYRVIAASQLTSVRHIPPPPAPPVSALTRTAIDYPSYGLGQIPGGPPSHGPGPPSL
jgi:hypothetical protein